MKKNNYKVIALIGKAGAGKDALLNAVLKTGIEVNPLISCTSRPMREGEQDGVNYYYYTLEEFENKIKNGEMLEYVQFNGWWYGLSIDAFKDDKINFVVMNPEGIRTLKNKGMDVRPLWVSVSDKARLMRQLTREENPNVSEIVRRFGADVEDFKNIDFSYELLPNETLQDFGVAVSRIVDLIGQDKEVIQ